ncbi:MAG: hypothetical protein E3J82_04155 [Candidatus Thorarchaeota archaeon]|nr:MAG: hypothetical protein E3J82_04155 [Candidatus Thorarchaeota archaeon]
MSPLFYAPVMYGEYSPAPALLFGGYSGYNVRVEGFVYWSNYTPAAGVEVRIFATDELTSETVLSDVDGQFYGEQRYESGQVLVLTIIGQRFRVFIPYFARGLVSLGDFLIDEIE